jgi:hypothetical protein
MSIRPQQPTVLSNRLLESRPAGFDDGGGFAAAHAFRISLHLQYFAHCSPSCKQRGAAMDLPLAVSLPTRQSIEEK